MIIVENVFQNHADIEKFLRKVKVHSVTLVETQAGFIKYLQFISPNTQYIDHGIIIFN